MSTISNINGLSTISVFDIGTKENSKTSPQKKDSAEISDTAKVFNNIDKFFNLGRDGRTELSSMNESEKKEFLKMTAYLIKHGVIGYEVREVNGKPEKHDVTNEIGDQRIYGTKLYKKPGYYKD